MRALGGSRQRIEGQRSVLPESPGYLGPRLTTVRTTTRMTSSGLPATAVCASFAATHTLLRDPCRWDRLPPTPAHDLSRVRGVSLVTAVGLARTGRGPRYESAGELSLRAQCGAPRLERSHGIPHSRQRSLATERSVRLLPEMLPQAANLWAHPTHTSDGTRRESTSTRGARDTDLLATRLPTS